MVVVPLLVNTPVTFEVGFAPRSILQPLARVKFPPLSFVITTIPGKVPVQVRVVWSVVLLLVKVVVAV